MLALQVFGDLPNLAKQSELDPTFPARVLDLVSLGHWQKRGLLGLWEITSIEPVQVGYVFSRLQVAETLVTTDKEGALVPPLVESWTVSQDGLGWTFKLRGNATFHDGTPVTAQA